MEKRKYPNCDSIWYGSDISRVWSCDTCGFDITREHICEETRYEVERKLGRNLGEVTMHGVQKFFKYFSRKDPS